MLIKYVLDKYELCLSSSPETVVNFNSVNLEHFLPQKPENWNLTIADVKGYVHNIGNLVLVDQSLNGQMGNKPLSEKLLIIDNSVLNMNRELIQMVDNNNAWDKNTIEERNKTIANILFSNV